LWLSRCVGYCSVKPAAFTTKFNRRQITPQLLLLLLSLLLSKLQYYVKGVDALYMYM